MSNIGCHIQSTCSNKTFQGAFQAKSPANDTSTFFFAEFSIQLRVLVLLYDFNHWSNKLFPFIVEIKRIFKIFL